MAPWNDFERSQGVAPRAGLAQLVLQVLRSYCSRAFSRVG
jgi:hypothetical protein